MAASTQKQRLAEAVTRVLPRAQAGQPPVTNHLVFEHAVVFAFQTDADLETARATGVTAAIREHLGDELVANKCAETDPTHVVSFLSEEQVDREGGPMNFFR